MPSRKNLKMLSPRDMGIFERVVVRGERQTALACEYELSKQRASKICDRVGQQLFRELGEDFSEHRRRTLLRLEHVYGQALDAWEKSKAGRQSQTETTNGAGNVMRTRTRQRTSGDVRYLTEARPALADLRDLCGLDATKTEIVELRESKTYTLQFETISDAELEKLATLAQWEQDGLVRFVEQPFSEGGSAENAGTPLLLEQYPSTQLS